MSRAARCLLLCLATASLAAQPDAPGVLTLDRQAEHALARGDASAAADLYMQLVRATPTERKWILAAADALGRAKRFNDALDFLDAARANAQDDPVLASVLAKTYMLKAEAQVATGNRDQFVAFDYQEAARLAEAAATKDPTLRDAHLILAEARYALGERDQALAAAEQAIALFPDHPGGHILVAKLMLDRFTSLKQRLNDEQPKGKALETMAGDADTARKRAVRALEAASTADADRAFPHKLLGDLHAWNGNLALALESYEKALAIDPLTPVQHEWIAKASKPDALEKLYKRALQAYGKRAGSDLKKAAFLLWHVGYTQFQAKRFKDARASFTAVVQANPEYSNSLYYIWLASYWLGDHAAAETQAAAFAQQLPVGFADTLRESADRAQVLPIMTFLAARAFKAKRLGESCALNHVLALVQDTAEAWNNYAFACREIGRFEASLAAYENALAKEPDSPQLLNDTAVILQYHLVSPENRSRAKGMYERAVQLAQQQIQSGTLKGAELDLVKQALQDARGNLSKF